MVLTPELSIVIAFILFALICAVKVYPKVVAALDEYIESVKQRLASAEELGLHSSKNLVKARETEQKTGELIQASRLKSEEKMRKLQEENERQLEMLRERHEASLRNQLEAELKRQKAILIDHVSDLIVDGVEKRAKAENESYLGAEINESDLEKLLR